MELVKKLVSVGVGRCKGTIQLTLDDDFNVPDRKPDVRQIIAEQGEIHTNDIVPGGDKVQVDGTLQVQIFYVSDQGDGQMQGMSGEIPFREWVNLQEACQGQVMVKWMLEDLDVEVINSRKISVRAIVSAQVKGEEGTAEEVASELEPEERIQLRKKTISRTCERLARKDTFRIKDEYILPSAKPNMMELVYQEASLRGVETRLLDDRFSLKGELHFMIFYYGEDDGRIQYLELELPFSGMPECVGCSQDMIPDIDVNILKKDIQVKADEDGEERILDIEVILELAVKAYGEDKLEILEDFYGVDRRLTPVTKELEFWSLAGKYSNKLRLNNRVTLPENTPGILQLCGTGGSVKVDECYRDGDGIRVEGIVELPILYITPEDSTPVCSVKGMLPFQETIPADGIQEKDEFEVRPSIDQVALSLLDGREVDAKATLNLETSVLRKTPEQIITGYAEAEIPEEELQSMPAITGYFVQAGDSWWTTGRKYRVPVDKLKEMNKEIPGELEPGMKLLIQREAIQES